MVCFLLVVDTVASSVEQHLHIHFIYNTISNVGIIFKTTTTTVNNRTLSEVLGHMNDFLGEVGKGRVDFRAMCEILHINL